MGIMLQMVAVDGINGIMVMGIMVSAAAAVRMVVQMVAVMHIGGAVVVRIVV